MWSPKWWQPHRPKDSKEGEKTSLYPPSAGGWLRSCTTTRRLWSHWWNNTFVDWSLLDSQHLTCVQNHFSVSSEVISLSWIKDDNSEYLIKIHCQACGWLPWRLASGHHYFSDVFLLLPPHGSFHFYGVVKVQVKSLTFPETLQHLRLVYSRSAFWVL